LPVGCAGSGSIPISRPSSTTASQPQRETHKGQKAGMRRCSLGIWPLELAVVVGRPQSARGDGLGHHRVWPGPQPPQIPGHRSSNLTSVRRYRFREAPRGRFRPRNQKEVGGAPKRFGEALSKRDRSRGGVTQEGRMDSVRSAFFAPGKDPSVWRGGWEPAIVQTQVRASKRPPSKDWKALRQTA